MKWTPKVASFCTAVLAFGPLLRIWLGDRLASGLRTLPDLFGTCRVKCFIFLISFLSGRTHNPLVPGSSPGGPTNHFDSLRPIFGFDLRVHLRRTPPRRAAAVVRCVLGV